MSSTWVVHCHYLSDSDFDRGRLTSSMIEVEASSRRGVIAAVRKKLGSRLIEIDYDNITEWKPGAFDAYVKTICRRA